MTLTEFIQQKNTVNAVTPVQQTAQTTQTAQPTQTTQSTAGKLSAFIQSRAQTATRTPTTTTQTAKPATQQTSTLPDLNTYTTGFEEPTTQEVTTGVSDWLTKWRERSAATRAQNTAAADALKAQKAAQGVGTSAPASTGNRWLDAANAGSYAWLNGLEQKDATELGRVGNIGRAAGISTQSSVLEGLGLLGALGDNTDADSFYMTSPDMLGSNRASDWMKRNISDPLDQARRNLSDKAYAKADEFAQQASEHTIMAKEGLGLGGSLLVDAGIAGTQMAGDIGLAALTGGSALLPMGVRAFGLGAQQARQAGASMDEQFVYGIGSAAVEMLTEKIASVSTPFKAYGKGTLDDVVEGTINKLASTAAGRTALKTLASAVSEGGEEAISDLANPVLQKLTYDPDALKQYGDTTYWSNMLSDAVVGGTLGLVASGVDVINAPKATQTTAQDTIAPNLPKATEQTAPVTPQTNINTPQTNPIAPNLTLQPQNQAQNENAEQSNIGYHFGDLGKADHLSMMSGRGTGHYGTGTYFFGSKDAPGYSDYANKGRPEHSVSFDGYNLYKPQGETDGRALHDTLKNINDVSLSSISPDILDMALNGAIDNQSIAELAYEKFPITADMNFGNEISDGQLDKYANLGAIEMLRAIERDTANRPTPENVKERARNIDEYIEKATALARKILDAKRELMRRFSMTNKDASDMLRDLIKYGNEGYAAHSKGDSPSTVLMKKLGYDGVDVRGIKGLDNSEFGSVIYDVKPNQSVQAPTIASNETQDEQGKVTAEEAKPVTAQQGTARAQSFDERKAAFNDRAQKYNDLLQGIHGRGSATDEEYRTLETEGAALNAESASLEQEQRVQSGQVSRNFESPENHIDNRTNENVKNPSVKAFQFDHPQLHKYFVEAAQQLQAEAAKAQESDGFGTSKNAKQSSFFHAKYRGPVRDAINLGLSKNEVMKCCEDIINNNGQENYAAAKRVELILDAMLSDGYTGMSSDTVNKNDAYIAEKEKIAGAEKEANRRARQDAEVDDFLVATEGAQPQSNGIFPQGSLGAKITGEFPSGVGAASRNSLGGMGPTKPTRFDINDQMDVDLDNLPAMSNQVNMKPQPKTGGLKTQISGAYTGIVDALNPIVRFSKAANDNTAMLASNSKNAGGTVTYIFDNALVNMNGDKIGVSLKELVSKIPKDSQADFWNYMMQRRNVNRSAKDTNVIANYNSRMSKRYVENIESQHPEWKPIGDDIVQWLRDFENAWSVDSGLVDAAIMQNLQNADPDYIPAQREFSETESALTGGEVGRKFVDQRSPIKKMEGSERDINNPVENIMRLVNTTVKTARYNQVGQSLLNTLRAKPMPQFAEIISEEEAKAARGNNIVSVIENGQKQYLRINDVSLLQALEGIPKSTFTVPIISGLNQTFKNLVTQKNPLFGITNLLKDVPTGYIYGSQWNPFTYLLGEAKAFGQIASGKESYQRYKAVGGGMSSFFSSANAETAALNMTKTKNVFQKVGMGFEKFNTMIEEATRLNEFNAVFSKTGDVQKALNAANDVTVNFARGGNITKTIDRNLVPYLNASVQGLDKLAKAFMPPTVLKTLLTGVIGITLPSLLLYLNNRDNPYYEELSNRTKDNYFCIPNRFGDLDDNGTPMTFIKIPKSRELGMIFGSLAERIARMIDGEEEAFQGFAGTLATNIGPTDPMDSGLIGPIVGLRSNEDFAGRTIVPQSMRDRSPHLQYDEKTSELTKYIAEYAAKVGIELSPKQMDYLVDSWTGVVGDFLLPLTTKGADALSPITRRFTADSRYSSQVITDFYDKMEEAAQKANDRNFAEGLASDVQTVEEKISSNYTKASKEISALSKVSNRAGIEQLTAEDKKLLREYGISTTGKPEDIQKAIRSKQIEIAREAISRGERASEMELDINNNSDIANAVERYQGAGLTEKKAYELYKALDALEPTGDNKSVTTFQKVQTIAKQSYTQKQKIALVASLYTNTSRESLLTDLNISDNLISRYLTTEDTDFINMTVPASFTESSVEYELTDKERQLFRSTYTEYFNLRATNVMSDDALKRLRDKAYEAAKQAVLRSRR